MAEDKLAESQVFLAALWLACRVNVSGIAREPRQLQRQAQVLLERLKHLGFVTQKTGEEPYLIKPFFIEEITSEHIRKNCDHDMQYTGTDQGGSHKGEDHYRCMKNCGHTEYRE